MRNELEKFNETISILVKAYLNDTLRHGDCAACAVGNLVSYGDKSTESSRIIKWFNVFGTMRTATYCRQFEAPHNYHTEAKEVIDSTGYTWPELAKIEYAFESAPIGNNDDEWMFNGLMSVVDVLAEIHGIDLETTEKAKLQFVR